MFYLQFQPHLSRFPVLLFAYTLPVCFIIIIIIFSHNMVQYMTATLYIIMNPDLELVGFFVCLFACLFVLTFKSTIFQSCRDGATASWISAVLSVSKVSCSRTQHGGGRLRTPDLSLRSPPLYH